MQKGNFPKLDKNTTYQPASIAFLLPKAVSWDSPDKSVVEHSYTKDTSSLITLNLALESPDSRASFYLYLDYGNGDGVDYTYNADGLRTKRTNGTTTYNYLHLNGQLVKETIGDTAMYFAYDADGKPMSVLYNDVTYYYVTNLQGDVVAILSNTGELVVSYTYDAWGNPLSTSGTMAETLGTHNPLRYRGYVYDAETGLYYVSSRYYDPEIGRWINADAFPSTGQGILGNNMFAYCGNNPANYSDPSGFYMVAREDISAYGGAGILCTVGISIVSDSLLKSHAEKANKKYSRGYTVYFLEDDNGVIQYVGRVTDTGYTARMAYHLVTRKLTPQYKVSGLRYDIARGLEEIGMIQCHTLNTLNPRNNQIHGIGLRNPNAELYMNAAIAYLFNKAEDTLLNLLQ